MNIYSIKDRLIDYYNAPFVAPNDKEALAGIAASINQEDTTHAIAYAPHHFELWRLGREENGHLVPDREFLADCGALVRARRPSAEPGSQPHQAAPGGGTGPILGPGGTGTYADQTRPREAQERPEPNNQTHPEPRRASTGGH